MDQSQADPLERQPTLLTTATTKSDNLASPVQSPSTAQHPALRILRKGDLVRIAARQGLTVKNRDGGLGRILRSFLIPQDQLDAIPSNDPLDLHPFSYDVEFVLGGKISGAHRRELVYTTADAEGMTADGSSMRARRKRKPSLVVQAVQDDHGPLKKKQGGTKKSITAIKKTTKKEATKNGTKVVSKRKATDAKGIPAATGKKSKNVGSGTSAESNFIPKDVYEKHHREFERMITRLEKLDQFGFFWGSEDDIDQDKEVDESNTVVQQFLEDSFATNDVPHVPFATECSSLDSTNQLLPKMAYSITEECLPPPRPLSTDNITTFTKSPHNWNDIRSRRETGRYEIDRVKAIDDNRRRRLAPYRLWKRKNKRETESLKPKVTRGVHPRVLNPKGVDWDLFRQDVFEMCDIALSKDATNGEGGSGTLGHAAKKIKDEMEKLYERTGKRHIAELQEADARHEFSIALQASDNQEAAFQGNWRKTPFPERKYDRLSSNLICAGLGSIDELSASYELRTTLSDGFVGISYKYNDTGQSEGWMKSVLDESSHESRKKGSGEPIDNEKKTAQLLAADQGVVRAQVQATMQHLLIQVQDKVMTDKCILKGQELRVANWGNSSPNKPTASPELVEQPVWGIDCYTRRNIMICLSVEFDLETALEYVEKWLLPAVNACPESLAYDLTNAAKILEGIPLQEAGKEESTYWCHSLLGRALMTKIRTCGPPWLSSVSYQLRRATRTLGYDFFRVHPKGHGSIVLSPMITANTLVTYYRGEVYPSWRWGEKMDAIEMTQERLGLRPNLPDFYNMALERPQADPRGYGLMIVDASRKSGHGSMLSHSCEPTCEVRMASLNGKLCLAMTTLRDIEQGEELTFDYNAITESLTEYSSAVCLCGFRKCRGSFLHFTTADCYQQVLNRNSPIAVRFANLVKGCMKQVMSAEDETILTNHGFGSAAFGAVSFNRYKLLGGMPSTARLHSIEYVPIWLRTYVADILRYIEYERRALPVALLCDHLDNFKVKPSKSFGKTKAKIIQTAHQKVKRAIRDKPENIFFYYCRQQRQHFTKILREQGKLENVKGLELEQTVKKAIGNAWKSLSEDMKATWKQRLLDDWKKSIEVGKKLLRAGGEVVDSDPEKTIDNQRKSEGPTNGAKRKKFENDDPLNTSKISFEAADAEGVSAMEQRIQQLTHALSRIGRVLDRHRQTALGSTAPSLETFNQLHAPLTILSDEKVVRWMWTDIGGPVQSLMHSVEREECARLELKKSLRKVFTKYQVLSDFSLDSFDEKKPDPSPQEARKLLVNALFQMRECILNDLREMEGDVKRCRRDIVRRRKSDRESLQFHEMRAIVATVLKDLVNEVAGDCLTSPLAKPAAPVNSMKTQVEAQLPTPIEKITSPLVADNDFENKYPPILLVHRELARLMEEIRRRDGDKQRFIFDKNYINMNASPALEAYIADKSKLPTFYKNVTRALIPIKFKDCFEALRDMIRNRFREGLPADDLMVEGPIYKPVKGESSADSPQRIRAVSLREHEIAHAKADVVHNMKEAVDDTIETTHMYSEMESWLEHFDDRWKLEAAADLLVLYARTSTFFELIPYCPLKSTPIEVYARELGNAVPKSKIEVAHATGNGSSEGVILLATKSVETKSQQSLASEDEIDVIPSISNKKCVKKEDDGLCEPDDVITQVTVGYDGDFVLSQLLQWYNGGIGQKQGLPDMLGCITLPDMNSCFDGNIIRKGTKANPKTVYASELRQLLVKWLQNPRQRGSPLPDELRQVFTKSSQGVDCQSNLIFLGSPVLDLLVMGDDLNIKLALDDLIDNATIEVHTPNGKVKSATERLQSTVDEGRPAQAVANWVQCENPACLKWRKVPWHVDLDTLPEAFFCKDNLWNSASNSCDNPEDVWDENDTHVSSDGTEKIRDLITTIPVEKQETPTKVKKIVSKKVSVKSHAAKILVENQLNDVASPVEQSPTASAPTLSEELSTCSEGDLLCKDEELSSEPLDTVIVSDSPSLNRLPRKKPNLEQNSNSGLLASFVIAPKMEPSFGSIPRKLTETLPRKTIALDEAPRRAFPSKVESLVSNASTVNVPRTATAPQALKRHLSSETILDVLATKVMQSPTKLSRWGPRLVNREDERTECSRYDLYDFEPLPEWHEDKPHPLLGLRFLQRKW